MENEIKKKLPKLMMVGKRDEREYSFSAENFEKPIETTFDGYRLDSLSIAVTLESYEEFEKFMKLLNYHKYCFNFPAIDL